MKGDARAAARRTVGVMLAAVGLVACGSSGASSSSSSGSTNPIQSSSAVQSTSPVQSVVPVSPYQACPKPGESLPADLKACQPEGSGVQLVAVVSLKDCRVGHWIDGGVERWGRMGSVVQTAPWTPDSYWKLCQAEAASSTTSAG